MLFGNPKTEEIPASQLERYLIGLFDAVTAKNVEDCKRRLENVEIAISDFKLACLALADVDSDPDDEFISQESFGTLKYQKSVYAKTLVSSIDAALRGIQSASGTTEYERLLADKKILEEFIAHLLKLNTSFRNVFLGYGEHFGMIKKTFKRVESSIEALRLELDKKSADFSKHRILMGNVQKLALLRESLNELKKEHLVLLEKANYSGRAKPESQDANLNLKTELLSKEISENELAEKSILAKINEILLPLERAARKYDHESGSKSKLAEAMQNAFASLEEDNAYENFMGMLKDMQSRIESIETDTHELELTKRKLKAALDANLKDYATEVLKLRSTRAQLSNELKTYRAILEELDSDAARGAESRKMIAANEEKSSKINSEIGSLERKIEMMVSEYYKKRIIITN
ncbi:MAG: hypothetical protein ACP5K9_02075 [Candidatus Micrarchaeia archaeon]